MAGLVHGDQWQSVDVGMLCTPLPYVLLRYEHNLACRESHACLWVLY